MNGESRPIEPAPVPPRAPRIDVSGILLQPPKLPSLDWWRDEVAADVSDIEFEVGPGKGLFLANAGALQPDRRFVGVEISAKYARLAAERIAKAKLANVRLVAGDAKRFLVDFVPDRSLAAVHVYFPDPWWKKRHKKRRVFSDSFLDQVERVLRAESILSIATDVEEYFEVMTALTRERPAFAELTRPVASEPSHQLDYLTNFERKFRIEGRAIHRARYAFSPATGSNFSGSTFS